MHFTLDQHRRQRRAEQQVSILSEDFRAFHFFVGSKDAMTTASFNPQRGFPCISHRPEHLIAIEFIAFQSSARISVHFTMIANYKQYIITRVSILSEDFRAFH